MLIFFCSPFAGPDQPRNILWAQDSCREIAKAGAVPFAPHLFFTGFLNDQVPAERKLGIEGGLSIMSRSDEVWFYLPPWRLTLSPGMEHEEKAARQRGLKVVIIKDHDEWEFHLARVQVLCAPQD